MIFVRDEEKMDDIAGTLNPAELYGFVVVLLTGAIGGCAAGIANGGVGKKELIFFHIFGYLVTGIFGALIMAAIAFDSYHSFESLRHLVLWSLSSGFATSLALCSTNVIFKVVLKKLGIEFEVRVKRTNKSEED